MPLDNSEINEKVIQITINDSMVIDGSDIVEFYFVEDLYLPAMIGSLTIRDRKGVVELAPITGNEIITFTYGEDKDKEGKTLQIFSHTVSPVSQLGQSKDAVVEMLLVDPIFFSLTTKKYSKGWSSGTRLSDIVKDICKNMIGIKKFFKFEESNEKIDDTKAGNIPAFVMQNWTPLEAIRWLMKRCSGKETKLPGYAFYNTSKGACFTTLENLFRSESVEKDIYGVRKTYKFISSDDTDDCKILSWELLPPDKQALVGLKGGHKMGFDFMNKSVIDFTYDYSKMLKGFTLLGGATLFPDISDDTVKYDYDGDCDEKILKNIAVHDFIRRYLTQLQCIITVRGNERRYPGMMVDLLWESSNPDEILNRELNGLWMIKSITHYFKPSTSPFYQQKMTLVTSAYTSSKYKGYMKTQTGKQRISDKKGLEIGR